MNSQIVSIQQALRSRTVLILVTSLIPISLFLKSGFVSVAVIWFTAFSIYNFRREPQSPAVYYFICSIPVALFLLDVIGMIYSQHILIATNLVIRKVHLMAIPFGFMLLDRRKYQKRVHNIVLSTFLAGCFLTSFVCLGNATINMFRAESLSFLSGTHEQYFFTSHALSSPLSLSAVYLSMYFTVALLVTVVGDVVQSTNLRMAMSIYLTIFIFLCGSMAGFLGVAVSLILWIVKLQRRKTLALLLVAGVLVAAIGALFAREELRNSVQDSFKFTYTNEQGQLSSYSADRLKIWRAAITAIDKQWLFGHGTGDGQTALEQVYQERAFTQGLEDELNAHNQFLSAGLDHGLVGILLLLAMMVAPFILALKHNAFLPAGFILVMFVFFLAESVLLRQKGIVFFSFLYCFMLAHVVSISSPQANQVDPR